MSAARAAEPIGTRVDVDIGWIEFSREIPLFNHPYGEVLSLTHRYQITESGLLLIHAEGTYKDERFHADIFDPKKLTGHVVRLHVP